MITYEELLKLYSSENEEEFEIEGLEYVEFEGAEFTFGQCLYNNEERWWIVEGHNVDVMLLNDTVTRDDIICLLKVLNYDNVERMGENNGL